MARLLALGGLLLALALPSLAEEVSNGGFESWDAPAIPSDWGPLVGVSRSREAHSGESSLLLSRTADEKDETGLNRRWEPDSGKQGTMLAALKGGLRFWYKALSADATTQMHLYAIAMSARPMEDTNAQRADFAIPSTHVGDGQWHQGVLAYDFTRTPGAKWVHIAPRMFWGAGALLLDDIEWVESVGPWLAISRLDVLAERPVLRASVANLGDAACPSPSIALTPPEGLTLESIGDTRLPERLAPGQTVSLHWQMEGSPEAGALVRAAARDASGAERVAELALRPELAAYSLEAETPVLHVGETTTVRLAARNLGSATQRDVRLQLEVPSELELVGPPPAPEDIPPRAWAETTVTVRAGKETPEALLLGRVSFGGEAAHVSSSLVVGGGEGTHFEMGDMRIVAANSRWGVGPFEVAARADGGWRRIGWVPHLGKVVTRKADGTTETLYLRASPMRGPVAWYQLHAEDSSGGIWSGRAGFTATGTGDSARMTVSVRCSQPREVLCFEGPTLWAETQGADALFPGVEWLEGDEVSSSALDIERGHVDQVRHVPHPEKITVPLMSVSDGTATAGLLWDCRQRWDASGDRPAAFFSAPGYLEGRKPATMGLMAPSIEGGWLAENARLADKPYSLPAGRVLSLEATLYASTSAHSALDAVDRWVERFGVPEPSALPRGSYREEVEFSAHAYFESLYVAKEDAWWHTKGGGPVMSAKGGPSDAFVWNLLRAANVTDDPREAALYRKWAAHMQPRAAPSCTDMGLEFVGDGTWAGTLLATATACAATQQPAGGWTFDADRAMGPPFVGYDYWELGDDNALESGTTAATAVNLLRCARVLGTVEAYEEGVRALRALEDFRVPRAAQVWEVPVHSPDILASADAMDACLEAYGFDGDPAWIEKAVYWARTGLPFVYLWDDPGRPYLRYASIPVFGASQNKWSWFGRPVQWNGLRYAGALLRLAELDDSLPWRQVAEGLVVSALHQQAPEGEDKGLWPDSIGAAKGDKSSWVFEPTLILEHVYTLLGQDAHPRTTVVRERDAGVRITSIGEVSDARWTRRGLAFEVAYPPAIQGAVLVAGVSRPSAVLLEGKAVPEGGGWPGWSYDAAMSLAVVRLPHAPTRSVTLVDVSPASPPAMPKPVDAIAFDFEADVEGWTPLHAVGQLEVRDGSLAILLTGDDPYVQRLGIHLTGSEGEVLSLRMRLTGGSGGGQLYWSTRSADYFEEGKVVQLEVPADGAWHELRLAVGAHPLWAGQEITGLRFDPTGTGPGLVEVDWVRLERAGGAG